MKWLKVKKEEQRDEVKQKRQVIMSLGFEVDLSEQEIEEKRTEMLPFLTSQEERKQKREVLT